MKYKQTKSMHILFWSVLFYAILPILCSGYGQILVNITTYSQLNFKKGITFKL